MSVEFFSLFLTLTWFLYQFIDKTNVSSTFVFLSVLVYFLTVAVVFSQLKKIHSRFNCSDAKG